MPKGERLEVEFPRTERSRTQAEGRRRRSHRPCHKAHFPRLRKQLCLMPCRHGTQPVDFLGPRFEPVFLEHERRRAESRRLDDVRARLEIRSVGL